MPLTQDQIIGAIKNAKAAGDDEAVAQFQDMLKVGGGESLLRGGAQSATLGLGDEIEGVIQAALPMPGDPESFWDRYRKWRDVARSTDERAQAANPKLFLTGQVAGGLATAAAPGAAAGKLVGTTVKAAGPLGRAINAASQAAPIGAVFGAGSSEGDLTNGEAGQVAWDAVLNALLGGGVGGTVAAVAPPLADLAGKKATEYGRKALSGISTPMSYTRKPIPAEAVEAAYQAKAIKPLGTVTGAAERLETAVDVQGDLYNQLVARLEAAGVNGPSAGELARRLLARAEAERPMTWQKFDPMVSDLTEVAGEAASKADPGKVYTHGYDPPLDLSQVRSLVGNAQQAASSEYAKIPNKVSLAGDAKMAVAGELRQAMEDAIRSQSQKAPGDVARFLPEKEKLANLLTALQEAREGAGKAARRGTLGLTDVIAATGAGAAGGPGAAATSIGVTKTLVPRIASTMGWSYRQAEDFLRALAQTNSGRGVSGLTPAAQAEVVSLGEFLRAKGIVPAFRAGADDDTEN